MSVAMINVVLVLLVTAGVYRFLQVFDLMRILRADLNWFSYKTGQTSQPKSKHCGPVYDVFNTINAAGPMSGTDRARVNLALQTAYATPLGRLKTEMRIFPFAGLLFSLVALNIALTSAGESGGDPAQLLMAIPVAMQSSIVSCLCVILLLIAQIKLDQLIRKLIALMDIAMPQEAPSIKLHKVAAPTVAAPVRTDATVTRLEPSNVSA